MEFKSYIKHDDCFNEFVNIDDRTVDLVCVDLPYGQTDCEWDSVIDLSKMWINLKRICKDKCVYVFFCTTKFGNKLINSNPTWFRYDLVWGKSKSVGFLSAKKMPLREHEMIYIFYYSGDDLRNERNMKLRQYAKKVKTYINKPLKEINKLIGNECISRFYCFTSTQFRIPSNINYNKLIEHFKINEMEDYIEYDELIKQWENSNKNTYNPQMTEGKPYAKKRTGTCKIAVYNTKRVDIVNTTGLRYPKTIINFNQPRNPVHPTQKPTDLLEWLIKTYSNDNDIVLDFTMGSGTTIEACINTKRRYIGIEKDKDIYLIAENRLNL